MAHFANLLTIRLRDHRSVVTGVGYTVVGTCVHIGEAHCVYSLVVFLSTNLILGIESMPQKIFSQGILDSIEEITRKRSSVTISKELRRLLP